MLLLLIINCHYSLSNVYNKAKNCKPYTANYTPYCKSDNKGNDDPNEEWCADFVSYIYNISGSPFINGNNAPWDENDANQLSDMGFSYHDLNSGYLPSPGDVAFFNYPGGHAEIVISGGKHPTFIYGDSRNIDPATGNGQMESNTTTSVDGLGQLAYYLFPN